MPKKKKPMDMGKPMPPNAGIMAKGKAVKMPKAKKPKGCK